MLHALHVLDAPAPITRLQNTLSYIYSY